MIPKFPRILTDTTKNDRHGEVLDALFDLDKELITQDNTHHLIRIYYASKQLNVRNKILKLLYDFDFEALEEFFSKAYAKERYLDMKLYALRGLANFVEEKEIEKRLKKFNLTLAKRQQTTPYNYQEYELLKGKNALPYLVEQYGYTCFKDTLDQVNQQYDAMPDAFKGHFTTDGNGDTVFLRTPAEINKIMDGFWKDYDTKFQ